MRTTLLIVTTLALLAASQIVGATPLATATRPATVAAAPPSLVVSGVIRCDLVCISNRCRNYCH
jgi:hypothetical protein